MNSWVVFTLVSALLFALGNALQKHALAGRLPLQSVAAMAARPLRFVRAFAASRTWLLGTALTLVAVAAETQALGLGEVSAVKPLSGIQSVFVLAIGVAVLGEQLTAREWLGMAVMLGGVWALALEPGDATPAARSTAASVGLGIGIGAAVALASAFADRGRERPAREWSPALAAGAFFGLGDVLVKAGTESTRRQIGSVDLSRADALGTLVLAPEFQLGIAFAAAAFLLQQLAFSRGRVSLAAPVVGMGATSLVVLLGVGFLGESLGAGRALGIGLSLLGTFLLAGSGGRPPGLASA
jgi:transporter family protein